MNLAVYAKFSSVLNLLQDCLLLAQVYRSDVAFETVNRGHESCNQRRCGKCPDLDLYLEDEYLEIAGSRENGLDCAHAIVVVRLRGQLFRTETISGDDLHRQRPRVDEAARV